MMRWWLALPLSVLLALPAWAADGLVDEKAMHEVREVVKQLQARY